MRYAKYKKTGIPWLPEVPEGWECLPFKRVAKVMANLVHPELYANYPQISPERIEKGSGRLLEWRTVRESNVESDNHLFRKGQIIYSKIRPLLNKVIIAPFDGLCSADMYPIETDEDTGYIKYYMLSQPFLDGVANAVSDRVKMPKINKMELATIAMALPQIHTQRAIVAYLDEKCGKVDRLVAAKEKEIELLKELKQTTIADAVTCGVDGSNLDVATNVFWQPKMPKRWKVRKLRYVLKKLKRERLPNAELLVCTNKGTVKKRGAEKIGLVSEDVSIYQGVCKGDLLIHGMDTWHGAIAVSELDGMCTPVVHVCDSNQNKRYIAYCLRNMARGKLFKLISNGVRQNTSDFRSWEKLAPLRIVLPPREEQERIVAYIERETAKIDTAVANLERQVAALKEYKQRLIADVVTGQEKVA